MSGDNDLGLIFLPLGSPSVDYWGGMRWGNNKYGNCLVALNAETGKVVWSFQTVHHDLWDYDIASQPTVTKIRNQKVVVFPTKTGFIYILDATTGVPFFEVEEVSVPKSDVPGEWTSPTQPRPKMGSLRLAVSKSQSRRSK